MLRHVVLPHLIQRQCPKPARRVARFFSSEKESSANVGFWQKLKQAFSDSGSSPESLPVKIDTKPRQNLFEIARPPTTSKQVTELSESAAAALKAGKSLQAKYLVSKALALGSSPEDWLLFLQRAEIHFSNSDFVFAFDDTRKALKLMPRRHEPYVMMTRILIELQQLNKARAMAHLAMRYGARKEELPPIDESLIQTPEAGDELTEKLVWAGATYKLKVLDYVTKLSTDPEYFQHIFQGSPVYVAEVDNHMYLRGAFATRDIEPGEVILCEDPLLTATFDRDRCSHCTKPLDLAEVTRCPRCHEERYCSVECSQTANKMYHNNLCDFPLTEMQQHMARDADDFMLASQIMIIKLISYIKNTPNWPCDPNAIREILHMQSLWSTPISKSRHERMGNGLSRWDAIVGHLRLHNDRYFDYEWYERMMAKVLANAFAVQLKNDKFRSIGGSSIALYRAASFFNHSCQPNAVWLHSPETNGARIVILATSSIKKDSQIFIPYVNPSLDTSQRRAFLLQRYGFVCTCPACSPTRAATNKAGKKG